MSIYLYDAIVRRIFEVHEGGYRAALDLNTFVRHLALAEVDVNHDGQVTQADIDAMSDEWVVGLVERHIWSLLRPQSIPAAPRVLCVLMDAAIHHGPGVAVRWLQEALGGIAADGVLGDITSATLQMALDDGRETALVNSMLQARLAEFQRLATNSATYAESLPGWNNRVRDKLIPYLKTLPTFEQTRTILSNMEVNLMPESNQTPTQPAAPVQPAMPDMTEAMAMYDKVSKWDSRKLVVTGLSTALFSLNDALHLNMPPLAMVCIAVIGASYLIGQGFADGKKEEAKKQ